MPKIVVEVMPKPELLDPQGKAIAGALARLGHDHITDVRVGKRFEMETSREASASLMSEISAIADELLANGVIEDVISIEVLDEVDEVTDELAEDGVVDGEADDDGESGEPIVPIAAASDAQAHLNERGEG